VGAEEGSEDGTEEGAEDTAGVLEEGGSITGASSGPGMTEEGAEDDTGSDETAEEEELLSGTDEGSEDGADEGAELSAEETELSETALSSKEDSEALSEIALLSLLSIKEMLLSSLLSLINRSGSGKRMGVSP